MRVYISGAITGTDDYMERFAEAEKIISSRGHIPVNPAKVLSSLPDTTTYREYIKLSLDMLQMCSGIYMLDSWQQSRGANMELGYAKAKKLNVIYEDLGSRIGLSAPTAPNTHIMGEV